MKKLFRETGSFLKKHLITLKVLFVLAVLVFVIFEVGRISQDLNGEQMRASLATQSPVSLLILLVVGLIAVTPMLTYDFVITELLPGHYKPAYVIKSGWIVNTFTNIAGFGGLLGASLRANFYHEKASQKQVLFAISKIAMFLLAGLSLWSMIGIVVIFVFGIGAEFANYWVWLVGGAAYFPLLMIISHVRDSEFFADMPLKRQLRLTLGSFLEWGGCAAFFLLIGYFLEAPIPLSSVLPLFMVANVIGVISMVPGGLGSFDVLMIVELGQLGLDSSAAVVWLLFYRLFYYVIPFLIGAGLFAQDAGKRLNAYLEGLPVQLIRKAAFGFLVVFLYFSGIMLLLRGVAPDLAFQNTLYQRLYPYTFLFLDRVTNVIVAFLILGFGRGIASRVKRAYWPTVIVLIVAMVASLREDNHLRFIVFLILVVIALILTRRELTRDRLALSWGNKLIDGAVFGLTFIFYAFAVFYNAPAIHHRHVPDVFLFPSERMFFTTLIGVMLAALTVYLIFRYLSAPTKSLADPYDEARLKAVVAKFGGNEVSHLGLMRDKSLHFYQVDGEDRVFFLFKKKADKLIVMGEPVGDETQIPAAIADFMKQADDQDMSLVFYEINESLTMKLHEFGFDFMKFGEEGYVDVTTFTLAGTKRKGERALMHKFEREGYSVELLKPPFDDALLDDLQTVSDSWLDGRSEKGFSLGFFDRHYLNQAPIAVVRAPDGKIVAFATDMPTGNNEVTSIDLMRSSADAPSGIMDEVFIHLFELAKDRGFKYFNMGMAPLANVGTSSYSFIEEKIAHLVYEYGYRFYGFQGLRSYKNKYVTEWVPKYVAYRKRTSLLFTLLQIMMVVNQKVTFATPNKWWPKRLAWVSRLGQGIDK
ncbi:bifunctional lysylphosphatidylglycerol flippase/synthetase MprF [Lacticaseibacillus paracasei]|uniref:bifunctional lysylphosphatidylglycerol flippase/synthetase MprF n=1 Tax=Lacticaseibacillus paracasei TaxID=1597 RepID=UPI000D39A137|nr:bifunctional lysylphosphatidylglycerol flippase/synthetase MprF [Lacticaseibacillus paracasei]PTS57278.1 bifunctional lysylphosphatidylglycerol flippase/synthetase MprF [Lactobacillus sp. DS22_6]MBS6630293.1 bifunctional lysylphosphatidylglycerol flippase/synthetase MprF [Lacticaseibacillus paracasei]MBX4165216.1 bifunctional lysylphosphatidylglycerol flippase/synthetase MprF [Lacticaseibacillus paracasei]MCZ2751432.1 bifunctional lysylphosphatidylglycerol flippase/synthetase MprF [Lacticase